MAGHCQQTFCLQCLLTTPSNGLPLYLKQTFQPIFLIFNEGKGDGIRMQGYFLKSVLIYISYYLRFS